MPMKKLMRKKFFGLTLGTLLFALCASAEAQQPTGKVPRIGYVSGSSGDASNRGPSVEAFRQGLRDLGYVEGKTSSSSIATSEESGTVTQPLWPNSCNSKSISL